MKGRTTPNNETDRQCEHCGLFFSRRGILTHERNCDLEGVDETIIPLDGSHDVDDEDDQDDETDQDVVEDVEQPSPESTFHDPKPEPEPEPATDGGPQAPPEPAPAPEPSPGGDEDDLEDDDQDNEPTVDELPERYVRIGEYLDLCRQRGVSDQHVDQLAARLAGYDVVDVEATTANHLEAYRMEDLT